jgi:hypothetical protein
MSRMYCHMPYSSRSYLPAQKGSIATMCPGALDPASLFGRASTLPRAPWLRTPPPYSGGLWCCHVSHGLEPRLPAREGSGTATFPSALSRPRDLGIKKGLADLGMQLGSHVLKVHSCVTKACSPDKHCKTCGHVTSLRPTRRADRRTQCNASHVDHS